MTDTQAEIHRPAPATFDSECQTSESESRIFLRKLLNRNVKIKITDGRVLIGTYLCTDKNANIVLGCCKEYPISDSPQANDEPRSIGLSMVPGHHIVTMHVDEPLIS